MQSITVQQLTGNTDIYLLDQIIKERYCKSDLILDAGCGSGRNMHWFLLNNIACYGVDVDPVAIDQLRLQNPFLPEDRLQTAKIENLPFVEDFFDHVISSAVLHFAIGHNQFHSMIAEMVRILKPGGTLFIRMTSNIGIENNIETIRDGVYIIPDGSTRFLLTRHLLEEILKEQPVILIEPLKTVNVADVRCMTTMVMQKTGNLHAPVK